MDEDVDLGEVGERPRVGDVTGGDVDVGPEDECAQSVGCCVRPGGIATVEENGRALGGEGMGNGETDALGLTGDERALSAELEVHVEGLSLD